MRTPWATLAFLLCAAGLAAQDQPPPVRLPNDPTLAIPPPEPLQVPVLLIRPKLPIQATPERAELGVVPWLPEGRSIQRISVTFYIMGTEWVTPRERFARLIKRSCPALRLVSDPQQAEAAFDVTFNNQTSVWTTVIRQAGPVDRFYTFAYPGRAPTYIAEQACLRTHNMVPPGKELAVHLPHGKWEGHIIHQTSSDHALELHGTITLDKSWLTIRGDPDLAVETRQIPLTSVRDLRVVGEKKELPIAGSDVWEEMWRGSYDCGEAAPVCTVGGLGALTTYVVLRPFLNMMIPTHHTLEVLFEDEGQPRIVVVELDPGAYERFAHDVAVGSKVASKLTLGALGLLVGR